MIASQHLPTGKEIYESICSFNSIMHEHRLLDNIGDASKLSQLQKNKTTDLKKWSYSITRSNPVIFKIIENDNLGIQIQPQIYITIETDENQSDIFKQLTAVLEIKAIDGNCISRWHIDLANTGQEGPKFHLQFGGNGTGLSPEFFKLTIPRIAHPPIDYILLCEIVISNFYPEDWAKIRQNPAASEVISQSEKMCYPFFFEKYKTCFSQSGKTILSELWNT